MQELLKQARRNFDEPGHRDFSWLDRTFYLNISRPMWCGRSDALFSLFENKKRLLANGIVVWGHIVQANVLLFERGRANCPASVVFSPDSQKQIGPSELENVAHELFKLKGTTPDESELKELADNLTDEMVRTFGLKVPQSASPQDELYEATTFVTRKHLPNGILSRSFFPLVITPESPYYNFPLPSRFWPKPLVDYWCN